LFFFFYTFHTIQTRPFYTAEQVREKHRLLIKRQHPDSGGSLYVATKINQAKDVLVKHLNNSSSKGGST